MLHDMLDMKTTNNYATLVAFVMMAGLIAFPVLNSLPSKPITTATTVYASLD